MADLRSYELKHFIGLAADTAVRTSRSITKQMVPMDPGGLQLTGEASVEDIPTEHGSKGILYRSITERNSAGGSMSHPFFPSSANLLAAAVTPSSAGIPRYYEIVTGGFDNLGVAVSGNSSPLVARSRQGAICSGFSLAIDRENPGPITLSTNWFLNAERDLAAASATSISDLTVGANRVVVFNDASGFQVGDYIRIVDADNSATQPATQIKVISGNNVTVDITVAVDGSGSTALAITKTVPGSEAQPTLAPYRTSDVFIDFEVADTSNAFTAWTGDNPDVAQVQIDYDAALTPRTFTSNAADPDLDGTWNRISDGLATLTGSVTLTLSEDAYLTYRPSNFIRKCRMRIMGSSAQANASTTTVDIETAATPATVAVTSATGLSVGDMILIDDGTKQDVATITAISTNTLTVDSLKVGFAAGAIVRNTAWEIIIPAADITAANLSPADENYTIAIEFSASVDATTGTIIEVNAYNDDNA